MKVLHVYKDFDPPIHGGMERHIALMCRYQREWAEVEALTCSRSFWSRKAYRDGTPVTEVGEWGRFQSAPLSPLFPAYLRRTHADIIVVHVPNPTAELGLLMARPQAPVVVRYHSDVVRQVNAMRVYRPVLMRFLARAELILPTSQRYLDTSPYLQPYRSKCRVVSLGIIPEEFSNADPAAVEDLRQRYGRYVLFTGRHRYYKGLEYLVRAAPHIDATVVISGDGPERPPLEALARELGKRIIFPGVLSQEELVNYLHGCAVFAFPSVERSEAFGISILEAQVCGKPVVATTLGTGVEFANLHGETGLNVPPRNPEALANAINELLRDEPRARAMGEFARARVIRDLDARRIAEQEFALYREVMECSRTGI